MKKIRTIKTVLILGLIFRFFPADAQHFYTVSGYVTDSASSEPLIGAGVVAANLPGVYTFTNEYGYFSLKVPKPDVELRFVYTGFDERHIKLHLSQDTTVYVRLVSSNVLPGVVIIARSKQFGSQSTGNLDINVRSLDRLPGYFGENDPLKIIQLMPGVVGGTDQTNALSIRGGSSDQNLVLLDGVTVYNPNHALGIFSVFNSDVIKNINLYKSGIPARYGGRLSSVIDIRSREGNMQHTKGAAQIGMLTAKFYVEGPVVRDKTSFLLSVRRSFLDLLLNPVLDYLNDRNMLQLGLTPRQGEEKIYPRYYFTDVFAKLNSKITERDRIYLSFYFGRDFTGFKYLKTTVDSNDTYDFREKYDDNFSSRWGNTILSLRWNRQISPNLFSNLTLTASSYDFVTGFDVNYRYDYLVFEQQAGYVYDRKINSRYESKIVDYGLAADFYYVPLPGHYVRFGAKAQYRNFYPAALDWNYDFTYHSYSFSADTVIGFTRLSAWEGAAYAGDRWKISPALQMNYGVRLNVFAVRDTVFVYPVPRLELRMLAGPDWRINVSVDRTTQFLHYLSNNIAGFPTDVWVPATDLIVPEKAWQFAAGLSYENRGFYASLSGFYKTMRDLTELREGESIFSIPDHTRLGEIWEQKVTQGSGQAYGLEFLAKKDKGRLTGWLSYTLSWSWRQFPDISYGKKFPYHYDRRNVINLSLLYALNDRINFSATWVYASGNPITIIEGEFLPYNRLGTVSYAYDGQRAWYFYGYGYFDTRNNYRLPAYHKLDLNVNFRKQKKKYVRIWSFALYKAYNRLNPSHIFLNREYSVENGQIVRHTYLRIYSFMPIMPMVSYKIEF